MASANTISSVIFMANTPVSLKFYDSITGAFLKEVITNVRPNGLFIYNTTEFINGEKVILSGTDKQGILMWFR